MSGILRRVPSWAVLPLTVLLSTLILSAVIVRSEPAPPTFPASVALRTAPTPVPTPAIDSCQWGTQLVVAADATAETSVFLNRGNAPFVQHVLDGIEPIERNAPVALKRGVTTELPPVPACSYSGHTYDFDDFGTWRIEVAGVSGNTLTLDVSTDASFSFFLTAQDSKGVWILSAAGPC